MPRPEQTPQQFGRGMIIAAWILLLVLLTWFFNGHLEQKRNPNQQLASTQNGAPEVHLKRNRYGHYVATGAINGQPVEFMLDTGATDVSIPVAVAERLELQRGQAVYYHTANGTIRAWQTIVSDIQLGPLRTGPVRASINPHANGEAILLGMSFLKELDFSQQGSTLTLKYPDPVGP